MRLFDVLGPVMIGPSSSHTAGAAKIGYTAQKLLGEVPAQADIGLYGSFATTGKGHGTDRALVAGLLGLRPDDPRLPDSFALAAQQGMQFSIHPVELRSAHPNTAVLTLTSRTGRQLSLKAASVGGGRIRVTEIDGVPADFGGDSNTLIIHNEDTPGCIAEVTMALALRRINIASMQVFRAAAGGYAVMVLECDSHIPHALERQLAVMPGLLGLRPDDPRLPDSFALAQQQGMKFRIHPVELRSAHPNTAVLILKSRNGRVLSMKAASVGGGRIRVTEIDGVPADFGGDSNTLIIHNEDTPGCIAEVTTSLAMRRINIASMQVFRAGTGSYAVMVLECDSHIPHPLVQQLAVMPGILKVTCLNVDEPEESAEE